jgi:hypothetical protein
MKDEVKTILKKYLDSEISKDNLINVFKSMREETRDELGRPIFPGFNSEDPAKLDGQKSVPADIINWSRPMIPPLVQIKSAESTEKEGIAESVSSVSSVSSGSSLGFSVYPDIEINYLLGIPVITPGNSGSSLGFSGYPEGNAKSGSLGSSLGFSGSLLMVPVYWTEINLEDLTKERLSRKPLNYQSSKLISLGRELGYPEQESWHPEQESFLKKNTRFQKDTL